MDLSSALHTKRAFNNEEGIALNIMYTAYMIKTKANALLKDYALSVEQYNILRILKGSHPNKICIKQIAERLVEKNANVPRTIDKLVAKRLVKRTISPTDKRETRTEISIAGIKLLETINPLMENLMKEICSLNKTEINQMNNLLEKYRENK